ncbi:sulfite oxidase [soil metagenome]
MKFSAAAETKLLQNRANPQVVSDRILTVMGRKWLTRLFAAASGILAAAAGVAVATAVAGALTGVPSPLISVGNRTIDMAPPALKDFAIKQFGTADKPILLASVAVVIVLVAAVAGVMGIRRPAAALGITALLGLVALGAAVTDRTATASTGLVVLPSLVAIAVSRGALAWLLTTLNRRSGDSGRWLAPHPEDDLPSGFERRRFLVAAMATGTVVVTGGAVTRLVSGSAAAASRADIRFPLPASPSGPVPRGTEVGLRGVSPYLTANADFYRIDTNLQVPDVPADTWTLRIHGRVDSELELSYEDLLNERLIERRITLTCVSNEVGGELAGNATWIGVPLKDLLDRAGIQPGADALRSVSVDDFTIGTPVEAVMDGRDAMIAIAMNGEPLPLEHGFPARMVVPGLYGYVSATKWLTEIEVTRFADFTAYWTERDWAAEAPIKTASRIDVPRSFQTLSADAVRAGGVAWAQTTGVEKVEVQVDEGQWQQVTLGTQDTLDTWRQWSWQWDDATPGLHTLTVRATDKSGQTQTSERVTPRPDGATGWHSVQFTVE